LVIEYHTTMRFAWLRQHTPDHVSAKQGFPHPLWLVRFAYNAVFWVLLLPFLTALGYGAGFVAFAVVILLRLTANAYTNNFLDLTPQQYEAYPFRIP
jgi:hypothetical protein